MSIKQEGRRPLGKAIKILNDDKTPPLLLPVMTSVPLAPTKQISLSIAKAKHSPTKSSRSSSSNNNNNSNKQMDHYVLQTIKGEANEEGIIGETIDFVLTDKVAEAERNGGLGGPSGEITEELHLSGDEQEEGEEKTEEIVEHVCGKCYKSFRRFSGLKKHLDFCRFDSGYHLRKAEMLKNLEKIEKDAIIMENKDICFCCGESYDTYHLGHINCPDCPKSFKTQMSYERHIFITHSEFNDHPCAICNAKLRSENLQNLHVEQHQNRGKPFACKICGKDFTRSYHLKRHQKYSSCSANDSDSMNCKVCNKVFFRLDNLRAHLKQHLGTHVAKKPEYMCPICKNCFYSLSTLNIHTRTHTGERPFDCDLCDKKFPSLVALKKHRRYHTGEKPYTCSVCNQSFAVKEVLNRHMKRHTGERPHVCTECGKSFIQATQLRSHARTHIRPFECTDCEEKFKTEKQFERHVKTHNQSTKRKRKIVLAHEFSCDICQASFKRETNLINHMKQMNHTLDTQKHSPGRTFCEICEKNFDTVKSLEFHTLKVHEVYPEEFINEKSVSDANLMPPPKKYKINSYNTSVTNQIYITNDATGEMLTTTSTAADAKTSPGSSSSSSVGGSNNDGLLVQEFIIDEMPSTSEKQQIILQNESFTVIPLESEPDSIIETVTTNTMPKQILSPITTATETKSKVGLRKTLAESLAAAIADDDDGDDGQVLEAQSEEDLKLKENVGKLLDMLVDNATLKKFGWPQTSEENVLCKVIENCGHDLAKDTENYNDCDYATRMREYVKLLFTVVIHNDSIKELLNNYPIDEVIEYVLGNDDEDDETEDNNDCEN